MPHDNNPAADTVAVEDEGRAVTVYRARLAGEVRGVAFNWVSEAGYGGPITLTVGIGRDGRIASVRVLSHSETPGLGDKIEPAKADWIHSFEGKFLGDPPPDKFAVKKDGGVFDQFAGATITPRAVVKAVKGGLEFFGREKARLLDPIGGQS